MEGDLVVRPGIVIPADELVETASRSGGPGGQHANKTSSRVTLRWSLLRTRALTDEQRERVARKLGPRVSTDGDVLVHVDEHRSQLRNREVARERLAALVRDALIVPRARKATKPTRSSQERRLKEKKVRAARKKDRGRFE